MKKINYILPALILWGVCSSLFAMKKQSARTVLDMNANWAFYRGDIDQAMETNYDDSKWKAVSIPHVMRLEPKHSGGSVFQGTGWYRRYFHLSGKLQNKRVILQFEGVQTNCTVFLNGEKIAQHAGGYIGFVVDITPYIQYDKDNILAIRVNNMDDGLTPPGKPMQKLDFNYYGGIYRDVKMIITNKTYISDPMETEIIAGGGVLVSFPTVTKEKATISCRTHIVNSKTHSISKLRLETMLLDNTGKIVARTNSKAHMPSGDSTFAHNLEVFNPQLWSPDHPFRYRLVSQVYDNDILIDEVNTLIGIRRFDFRSPAGKADGFYLNGKKLYLRGANRHQAFPYVGDAASNSMQYRDAMLLKKGGFNAVRAAHYPPSPAFLDACDSLGLLVVECQPGWQYFNDDELFIERTYRDIRKMIRRDRNHPSIFLWETSLNESPTPSSWMKKAVKIAHDELPGDQLFTADDLNNRSQPFYDVFYKVIDPDGTDPLTSSPSLTREWGDAWFADASKENGLRASRRYGDKGLINQSMLRQNALNGEKEELLGGYWDHAGLDANPRIGGYFLWSFNDYTRGYDPVTASSGVVDLDRYPKFGYYQMKAMQDARNPTCGPIVHIATHNTRKDLDTNIIVFSNCDTVRLFRNNKLVGEKTRENNSVTAPFIYKKGGSPYFCFKLKDYEPGELKAEGILDGGIVCTHQVSTATSPHHLKIEFADQGIASLAGGSDMIPVYIKIYDEKGNLVSSPDQADAIPVKLVVSGKGRLIGGNNHHTGVSPQFTEGGIAYALIRTMAEAGQIIIEASSDGLQSATAKIESIPSNQDQVPDGKRYIWMSEHDNFHAENIDTVKLPHKRETLNLSAASVEIDGILVDSLKVITDRNLTSSWRADKLKLPIAISIDLGDSYDLDSYRIYWGKDSDWYLYSLESSTDGATWSPIGTRLSSSGQDYSSKSIKQLRVRYIRFLIEGIKPENSIVAVREIELSGKRSDMP